MPKRLTYKFYSTKVVNGSIVTLTTDFPFTFDTDLFLPRSITQDDVDNNNGALPVSDRKVPNGVYSNQLWSIFLVKNDNIVPNPTEGVDPKLENFGTRGVIVINTAAYPVTDVDKLEIAVVQATVWTPWIYYGLIPERAALAFNEDRFIASMGGIHPSLLPAQAVGFRYFVDAFSSSLPFLYFIPWPTIFFLSVFDSTSAIADLFMMADVVNGDGSLAWRSNVNLKIKFLADTLAIGGNAVNNFGLTEPTAIKTINYREMSYRNTTFSPSKLIKNTDFLLCFDQKNDLKNFYSETGSLFNFISEFVDMNTCTFSIFEFGSLFQRKLADSKNKADIIQSIQDISTSVDVSSMFSLFPGIDRFVQEKLSNPDRNCAFLVFTDFIINDESSTRENFNTFIDKYADNQKFDYELGLVLTPTNTDQSNSIDVGESIFGTSQLFYYNPARSTSSLGLLDMLANTSSSGLNESTSLTESKGVNANEIRDALKFYTDNFIGISSKNHDNDIGTFTSLIDRTYDVISSYNPRLHQDDPTFHSLLGTRGTEIRLHRKLCPIGQLFRFKGKLASDVRNVSGGSLMFEMDIVWQDDKGILIENQPSPNRIWVYVEYGARSNLSSLGNEDQILEVQGRLFYPDYMLRTKLNNLFRFNNPTEIAAWFRVFTTTATDIINFGYQNPLEPMLIVRSNITPVTEVEAQTGLDIIPPIFDSSIAGGQNDQESYYKISQKTEEVGDYINSPRSVLSFPPISPKPGDSDIELFKIDNTDGVVLDEMKMTITIPDSVPKEKLTQAGNFEYELIYTPSGTENSIQLAKFFSAAALTAESNRTKEITIILSGKHRFLCKQPTGVSDGKTFNIVFPYFSIETYIFKWDPAVWKHTIYKNFNTVVNIFDTPPNPETGEFVLSDAIDTTRELIYAEFQNEGGGQKLLKIGNSIKLNCLSGPVDIEPPIISNVVVNYGNTKSIERVEGVYSATIQPSDSYFQFTPAYGFKSLSGNGWDFSAFETTQNTSFVGNFRINGHIISPVLYLDPFAVTRSEQALEAASSTRLPTIDIVYSNVANTQGKPFAETLLIEFIPPPSLEIRPTITSEYNKVTERFTIISNIGDRMEQKYSFTEFKDRDTAEGYQHWMESLRHSSAIFSGDTELKEITFSGDSENGYTLDVAQGTKPLAGLFLNYDRQEFDRLRSVEPINLQSISGSGLQPYGYIDSDQNRFSKVLGARDKIGFYLPDTSGVSQIKVSPENGSVTGNLQKAYGLYVGNVPNGTNPAIRSSVFGEYFLFFNTQPTSSTAQIVALVSYNESQHYYRPGVKLGEDRFGKPIVILEGYTVPKVIYEAKDDHFSLFAYELSTSSIIMTRFPRSLLLKLRDGSDEGSTPSGEEPREISEIIRDDNVTSWKTIFARSRQKHTVIDNVSDKYSVHYSDVGILYCATVTKDNKIKLLVSQSSGSERLGSKSWHEISIDLMNEASAFYQSTVSLPINAITCYHLKTHGQIQLYVGAGRKLLLLNIPQSLSEVVSTKEDKSDIAVHQAWYNSLRPILVIGTVDDIPSDTVNMNSFTDNDFIEQTIAVEYTSNGNLLVFYLNSDGNLKCRRSKNSGLEWRDYDNF